MIAGLAGVALIVGMQALGGIGRELWSQLAIVAATVCYAGAAIFGRTFSGHAPIVPAAGSMLCGAAIGVVFLGESLSSTAWAGLVCVVLGVAAMTVPARK